MDNTLRQAVAVFRMENALNPDEENDSIWLAQLGKLIFPLPNFQWRREAIGVHDAHHLITGFSTSVLGECQVAAWEYGARCYGAWQAKLLCIFLMGIGLLIHPRKIRDAYQKGRQSVDLYTHVSAQGFLDMHPKAAKMLFNQPSRF